MNDIVEIEIAGFSDSSCGPFPCDGDRTCELEKCAPSENLVKAFEALSERIEYIFGSNVALKLTLLDDGVPDHIVAIIEEKHPPIPIVIVNGRVTPIGRISFPMIREEIERAL
jgi:hypothetical protein